MASPSFDRAVWPGPCSQEPHIALASANTPKSNTVLHKIELTVYQLLGKSILRLHIVEQCTMLRIHNTKGAREDGFRLRVNGVKGLVLFLSYLRLESFCGLFVAMTRPRDATSLSVLSDTGSSAMHHDSKPRMSCELCA